MKAKVEDRIRGSYYYSQTCKYCQKLIVGQSEESRKGARTDLWRKMKRHGKDFHPEIETQGHCIIEKMGGVSPRRK